MNLDRWIRSVPFIVAALLSGGCHEEVGPEAMRVARVRGIVKQGQRPVSGGWIEFTPVDGTVGKLRSARLQPDGRFEAEGVAVGKNAIRVVNARIDSIAVTPLFSAFTSPIRRVIAEDSSAPLTIDLLEEAVRFEQQRRQAMTVAPPATGEAP
jgi:hypothetical protein